MSKRILITGGSGFIGSRLITDWLNAGHQVVVFTRRPSQVIQRWDGQLRATDNLAQLNELFDWLVNLAGEGIADQRWSSRRKDVLRQSRVDLTRDLLQWAKQSQQSFELVLSGSAVGYYGSFRDDLYQGNSLTEADGHGAGFAAHLCRDWEHIAEEFTSCSERLVLLRTGIVLGPRGGMLKRLWLPFSVGLGGVIGAGNQVLSWIDLEDYVSAIHHITGSLLQGTINMTAPKAVTNREFTRALAAELKRPALFPMPKVIAKLLFGEMSELLLEGQRVQPQQLLQSGFQYKFVNLEQSLQRIHHDWSR
ncbi:TIGR01777 family oxidoreductase [Bacterioplanoides sp.]|uniref:TIGR01777 family oxidoreductase n=1 Tax=Bacterioplanoides sp. TaxID=2066072 RepID=UPI003B0000D8